MPLKPEDELKGRYKIIKVIGKGGMGSVYLAEDWLYKEKCAVKEMLNNFTDEVEKEGAIKRFKNEAQILVKIKHKNIPGIIDYFIENNCYYLVMKYIEGKNLQELIDENRDSKFSANQIIDLGVQICEVLIYLHNHKPDPIVFRDIKPTNIIIETGGNIMLVDFGIAKVLQPKKAGTITGTPGFASPEQYQGLAYPVSDIYSLGATLHYLYTGRDPYREAPFSFPDIFSENHSDLGRTIMKALSMKMEDRYESALDMKNALLYCRKTEIKLAHPEFILPSEDSSGATGKEIAPPVVPEMTGGENVNEKSEVFPPEFVSTVSREDERKEVKDSPGEKPHTPAPTEAVLRSSGRYKKKKGFVKFIRGLLYFSILAIILAGGGFYLNDYLRERKADILLDEAREFFKDEDYKEAIEKYGDVLDILPDSIEAHRGLAQVYTEKEEYEYARLSLERAFDIDREDEETILAMAQLFWEKEDIFNAQIWYKKVLVINKDNPEAINGLGDTYFAEKDYTSAIVQYKRLLDIDPDSVPVRLKVATAYKKDKDYENAMKWYSLALKLKDNTPEARLGMSDIYIMGKKYDDAIVQYKKILDYDSRHTEATASIGDVYRKKKEYDKAMNWYDKALDIDGEYVKAKRGKAEIYISRKEDPDRTLKLLKEILKQEPDEPLNHNTMGRYYVLKKEYDLAIKSYKKAIDLDPDIAVIHFNLGLVYAHMENYDKAVEAYDKAIDLEPSDSYFHYNLGRAYDKEEKFEDALKEYNISIKLDPDYAPPYYDLGKIYLGMKKFKEALVCFNKVVELEPDSNLAKEAEKGIKIAQYYI